MGDVLLDGVTRPDTWPTPVRVSMFPDRVLEVGPEEWADLKAQGLLIDDGTAKPEVTNAEEARAAKAKEAATTGNPDTGSGDQNDEKE